jgi:hypothetical protein
MGEIPANVMSVLRAESNAAHTNHMKEALASTHSASNIVRHSAARMIDEPSPQQARAIDKILRLPNG